MDKPNDRHFFPFLWVHGETEDIYRHMVRVIRHANLDALCIEARPHPGFGSDQWWADLAILLDEAQKQGMLVWILDDMHFPTGYAAGAVKNAPLSLHRRFLAHRSASVTPGTYLSLPVEPYTHPKEDESEGAKRVRAYLGGKIGEDIGLDELLSCTAVIEGELVDLTGQIVDGVLEWDVPNGVTAVDFCLLTYDSGLHRDYINMLDEQSCHLQIDAVYEPHYTHFGHLFGTVIAGFFSDEPELGNGDYTNHYSVLGIEQSLPYSESLNGILTQRIGGNWKNQIIHLWRDDLEQNQTAKIRSIYMDAVSRLVERNFSRQIGDWCRGHGVEYIGHIIEDENQHARTGTSLGHYFRCMMGQSMAGIDNIGGQLYPSGEDRREKSSFDYILDGEFYHYALGKLASSMAEIVPHMEGRSMCELFGNYGWAEGVKLESYQLDHLMVRGVNHFVPHAFTCSIYPDPDCPPHFYAQGNNPQYQHFGELMRYGQKVTRMISGGRIDAPVAILYHGEAEWAGECMLMQKPARALYDRQIDFRFLPADVFAQPELYRTECSGVLTVNGLAHRALVVPYAQYLPMAAMEAMSAMIRKGFIVIFIDGLPRASAMGEPIPEGLKQATVLKLGELADELKELSSAELQPVSDRLRVMHYLGNRELYYFFNESETAYQGKVKLARNKYNLTQYLLYDPWRERYRRLEIVDDRICLAVNGYSSAFIIQAVGDETIELDVPAKVQIMSLTRFWQSTCRVINYPAFGAAREMELPEAYEALEPAFSGIIRYETTVSLPAFHYAELRIEDAAEGVEVFVNGTSAGIQIRPVFRYNLSTLLHSRDNTIVIEVATNLARERGVLVGSSGITGAVTLRYS